MHNVVIRRPRIDDLKGMSHFFRVMITDTFAKEGLSQLIEDIEEEVQNKIKYINIDFESNGESYGLC